MNAVSSSALKGVFLQDGLQIPTPDSEDRHWTAGFVRCSQLSAVRCSVLQVSLESRNVAHTLEIFRSGQRSQSHVFAM